MPTPPLNLSKQDARALLAKYHFKQQSAKEVFTQLGSIQFDPLNPVGRNHDLVLQARVAGYQVDDWQHLAYGERFIYDFWDKQASLVLMQDWPKRHIYHKWNAKHWQDKVLKPHAKTVKVVLEELRDRGPLTSTAFEHQPHVTNWEGSWYGPKLTKNVLRALWHTGQVVTHSRKKGHHVYDLAENVIPHKLLNTAKLSDKKSIEFLLKLRHKAVGLLSPSASTEVWTMNLAATKRKALIEQFVKREELLAVNVDGTIFHAFPETLKLLDETPLEPRMIFVAPLDQLMWDRKAIRYLFDFDYVWEVYKPEKDRKWGYYVLPVFYNNKFVARFDSRLKDGIWELYKWYWEKDTQVDTEMLKALERSVTKFKYYLRADKVVLPRGLDRATRSAWQAGAKA